MAIPSLRRMGYLEARVYRYGGVILLHELIGYCHVLMGEFLVSNTCFYQLFKGFSLFYSLERLCEDIFKDSNASCKSTHVLRI